MIRNIERWVAEKIVPLTAIILLTIVVLAIANSCGGEVDEYGSYRIDQREFTVNGRTVTCLVARTDAGGVSIECPTIPEGVNP